MPETTDQRLEYLFNRYVERTCSPEERDELMRLINLAKYDEELKSLMDRVWTSVGAAYQLSEERSEHLLSDILALLPQRPAPAVTLKMSFLRWSAIAACLAILTGGFLWLKNVHHGKEEKTLPLAVALPSGNDIAPGGNKAVLTLANGSKLILDSVHNGIVAAQGGIRIIKSVNGLLTYNLSATQGALQISDRPQLAASAFNTLTTPRGGQYKVILPDGSKVWLNAASSLRFPMVFTGRKRKVELTGEAYFEVAKNANMPFVVTIGNAEVDVLGTHFNVNAYDDEPNMRVTLLEGSVKVQSETENRTSAIIQPGEQAQLDNSGQIKLIRNFDINQAIAWKNGLFIFNNTDIQDVMRQIARWYNAEVVYDGNMHSDLNGMIARNTNLSEVLHMLELTGEAHFKVEGNKIEVKP